MNYKELSELSNKFNKSIKPSIIQLPTMRVLSSLLKISPQTSDPEGFLYWLQKQSILIGRPGWHEQFELQENGGDIIILRIDDNFINDSEYWDYTFKGGLFAAVSCYIDEDLEEQTYSLISYFDGNEHYEINYNENGSLRYAVMLENLISPENKRELVSLFVPVKKN
mgnify:CR=1 FL=1|jgi:hypothetical protein